MDKNITTFLRILDPEDNQTGGGAASALAGAMAAALAGMVARLSIGRKGMAHSDDFYRKLDAEAQNLSSQLFDGAAADAHAFEAVMQAYRLPKESEAKQAGRSRAIQDALIQATLVPLQNSKRVAQTLELCDYLAGRSNPNAVSDLECAKYLAQASLLGNLSNARINLDSIRDQEVVKELQHQLDDLNLIAAQRRLGP